MKTVSYIGSPADDSVMYVSKKVEKLLDNLKGHTGCIVFCEDGCNIPAEIEQDNEIVMTATPQLDYAKYIKDMQGCSGNEKSYTLTEQGYWTGEDVIIGSNVTIEPMCLIGHGVVVGDNTVIRAGSRIFRAVIGSGVLIESNVVIGCDCFTYTRDEEGNMYKIPTMGNVAIGDNVSIGAGTTVEAGSAGTTTIEEYAKIDMQVCVGHDDVIGRNSEITECVALGGFVSVGQNVFIGMNATVRNRVSIGDNSNIGMGCIVARNIPPDSVMVGNMIGSSLKRI